MALVELLSFQKHFHTSEAEQEPVAELLTEVVVVWSTNGNLHGKCTQQDQPCLKVARWPPTRAIWSPSIFPVSVYIFEASVNKQTFQFSNVHLTATIDVSSVGLMLCCTHLIPLVIGSFTREKLLFQ